MKLKQKLALGLSAFYLVSVIGVALSMHFCGGKLASVSVFANEVGCKYCKAELVTKKDNSCCKNTKVEVKVKDNHKAESSFKLPKLFSLETLLGEKLVEFFRPFFPSFFSKVENKAPPKSARISLHLLNCVFRN